MHLVTGRAGSAHINSDMVGRFNAGTIGDGAYILNTQNKMICTVADANHVTIATGDAVVQGRHVTNEAAETLTIQSGGQGVSRHDLVCVRYTNSGGIESAELVVITGTASAAPVDPSYNDGSILDGDTPVDIPLYRLVINGINLDSVDALAETIEPFTLNGNPFIAIDTVRVTVPSTSAGVNYSSDAIDVTKSGYTPIGVIQTYWASGSGQNKFNDYGTHTEGNSLYVRLWNAGSSSANGTLNVIVLYANSAIV